MTPFDDPIRTVGDLISALELLPVDAQVCLASDAECNDVKSLGMISIERAECEDETGSDKMVLLIPED